MKSLSFLSLVLALLLPAGLAAGDTLRVPGDFETIQQAVDAAVDGDVVVVRKGTYPEKVTIRGKSGVVLKGKGKPVIDAEGSGNPITIDGCTNVDVVGFVLDQAGIRGVIVTGSSVVTVSKCTVRNSAGDGVVVHDSSLVVVTKCRFEDIAQTGVSLLGGSEPATNSNVVRCRFTRCGLAAVGVHGDHNLVEKNKIIDTEIGIHVTGQSNDLLKNRLSKPVDGVWLDGSENRLQRNKVKAAEFWGLYVDSEAAANVVEQNVISRAGELGMYVWGTGNRFASNRVVGAGYNGIELADGATGNILVANKAGGSRNLDMLDNSPEESNTFEANKFKKTE
ncbi:MAG: right-handed parallel beta-helix repeat-containing protein [Planctomycetota bacterium]|jgi:hypothetical protein